MDGSKHIVLKDESDRSLFNEVKGLFMNRNPSIKRVTDDIFITYMLKYYKNGGKNGR